MWWHRNAVKSKLPLEVVGFFSRDERIKLTGGYDYGSEDYHRPEGQKRE